MASRKSKGDKLAIRKENTKKILNIGFKFMIILGILSLTFIKPLNTNAIFVPKEVDAYELIVDGETWFILENVQQIAKALDQFKTKMTPALSEGMKIVNSEFVQNIEIVPVRVNQSKLNIVDNLTLKLNHPLQSQNNYYVQEGDSAWKIAEKLGMTLQELEQLNPDIGHAILQPGDEVIVSSIQYYLDVNVTLSSIVNEVIHYQTKTTTDANLTINTKKVTKEGVDGLKEVTYLYELRNGVELSSSILAESIVLEPVVAELTIGSKPVTVRSSGTNFGVTTGRLSSDFGYRKHPISGKRSFHDGIDIANKVGTSINAYRDGTVTKTGWTDSYGNYIIIDHGGGLETYYIHLSGFDVSNGDSVSAGQLIGRMGKTGSATGSHLQFEVRLNGTPQNPWDYL